MLHGVDLLSCLRRPPRTFLATVLLHLVLGVDEVKRNSENEETVCALIIHDL